LDEQLEAFLDGALTASGMAALQAHVENCSECQKLLQQERLRIHRLQREAQVDNWSISPDMAGDIQRNIYRRMRRAIIVQNMKLTGQGIVAAVIILIIASVFIWWQIDLSTSIADQPATPVANVQTLATTARPDFDPNGVIAANNDDIAVPIATADLSLPADTGEPVTLRLAVYDSDLATYERLIDAFEEENPNIRVELVTQTELLGGQSISDLPPEEARLKIATGADVLTIYTTGESIREGLRYDLSPFIAADSGLDPDDFYPGLLENYQSAGKIWAIPLEAGFTVLVYNKDLFEAADLDYPQTDWNWEELLDAALALTVYEGDEVQQWGFLDKYVGIGQPFPGLVGLALTSDGTVVRPRFDDPDFIAGTQWYVDLFLTHEVAPYWSGDLNSLDALNTFLSQAHGLIQSDRVAMWTDNSVFLTNSFIPGSANWGIVPLPSCSPASSSAVSISAGTQHPAAAWRLVSFLSEQLVVAGSISDLPQMPARRSVAQAGGFYEHEQVNSELANTLRHAVEEVCPTQGATAVVPNEVFASFNRALVKILAGEQPVRTALLQAQQEAEQAIADLLVAQANATPVPPFTVASSNDGATVSAENAATIRFRVFGASEEAQIYRNLAQQFTAANPAIIVEVEPVAGTSSLAANAVQSDCFQGFSSFNRQELSSVLALDPFLDADSNLSPHDFYPLALDAFSAQGQLWGLPGQMDITLIGYNKDLFDAAGVPYPTSGWTMSDFLAVAQALTQGEDVDKQYGFIPGSFESTDLLDWLERLGADLIDETANPPVLFLNDPTTVAAFQWYTDLITMHQVRPTFSQGLGSLENRQQRRELIENGRAAMWIDSAFSQGAGEVTLTNVGYVPLPVGQGGLSHLSYQSITGYFISAETTAESRQACWQWMTYLTGQPDVDAGLSARQTTVTSVGQMGTERTTAWLQSVQMATQPAISQQLAQGSSWLLLPFVTLNESLFAQLISQIVNGGNSVAPALTTTQEQLNTYMQCVQENSTLTTNDGQLACWMQVNN
jgi:multiple sugar transport system substrate-binding protein